MTRNDPAIVNLPLAKRGNIDRQLDAYKAQQAAESRAAAKAQAAETRALRAQAKRMVDAATDAQLAGLVARTGKTTAQVRAHLRSEAHWSPALVIRHLQ